MRTKRYSLIVATFAIILVPFSIKSYALHLRTASQSGSEPKYMLEKGRVAGLEVEIIEAVQSADPRIRITGLEKFMPFKRIKLEMERGNLDCFFGFSYSEERSKKFWFVQPPLYMLDYRLVMRADDPFEPESFDDIRALGEDGVILALYGTVGPRILRKEGGLVVDDGGQSLSTMLRKLTVNRGRFLFYQSIGTIYTIKKMGLEDRFRLTGASFANEGHYLAFPRASISEDIVRQLAAALQKVRASGELERIVDKYESE